MLVYSEYRNKLINQLPNNLRTEIREIENIFNNAVESANHMYHSGELTPKQLIAYEELMVSLWANYCDQK